jgi:3-isopropylmalate/(R)-2-methylmalate dehydratase large subunit
VVCEIDMAMTQDIHAPGVVALLEEMGVDRLADPESLVVVMDHQAPSHTVENATEKSLIREFVAAHPGVSFYDVGTGISHEVLPEEGHVRPGELIVGTDSHTTTHGAFGAAGTGIGDTEMAYALATGQLWFRVPETVAFEISGRLPAQVSAKDIMLAIAGRYGTDVARYRAVEFQGPTVERLAIDDRMTLTNMSIELGAKFGFTPVDDRVEQYVRDRTDRPFAPATASDPSYAAVHEIDVEELAPQVAVPHSVENVHPIDAVEPVALDQVFLGSCTNGKLADLRAAAALLEGRTVADGTRLIVTPASRAIQQAAEAEGLLGTFLAAGASVTSATCGACPGLGMGVLGAEEVCLAAQNRNFRGRMGDDSSAIYLASPETAAASAVAGRIADPREVAP